MTLSIPTNMVSRARRGDELRAIRRLIDARVWAVRAKNVDALLSQYASDVCTFDLLAPASSRGIESVRKRLTEWFGSFASSIDYEITGIEIETSGVVAFDHHFTHVRGKNVQGIDVDMWFRESVGWRKERGVWKVAHQHSSAPFDMASMKAMLDLAPDT